MKNAINKLTVIFNQNNVDHTHGISHALIVVGHAIQAIKVAKGLGQNQSQNILLACLLHDADDKKYFPQNKNYDNAWNILKGEGLSTERVDEIVGMIRAVSYSKNGDNVDKKMPQHWYYPRYCDRIDAIGYKGLVRAYQYAKVVKNPTFCQNTEKPLSLQELMSVCNGRDLLYVSRGGTSQSFIDHIYDKLMHLKLPQYITNSYLQYKYEQGKNQIADFVLRHAKSDFKQVQAELQDYIRRQQATEQVQNINLI